MTVFLLTFDAPRSFGSFSFQTFNEPKGKTQALVFQDHLTSTTAYQSLTIDNIVDI